MFVWNGKRLYFVCMWDNFFYFCTATSTYLHKSKIIHKDDFQTITLMFIWNLCTMYNIQTTLYTLHLRDIIKVYHYL